MKNKEYDCRIFIEKSIEKLRSTTGEIIATAPSISTVTAIITDVDVAAIRQCGNSFKAKIVIEMPEPIIEITPSILRKHFRNIGWFDCSLDTLCEEMFGAKHEE